jgi:hypothetical protein
MAFRSDSCFRNPVSLLAPYTLKKTGVGPGPEAAGGPQAVSGLRQELAAAAGGTQSWPAGNLNGRYSNRHGGIGAVRVLVRAMHADRDDGNKNGTAGEWQVRV